MFESADAVPFAPLDGITLDRGAPTGRTRREADYLSARGTASRGRRARRGRPPPPANYPSLSTDADYGAIGSPRTSAPSHGTFSVAVTLNVPIFQGHTCPGGRSSKLTPRSSSERPNSRTWTVGSTSRCGPHSSISSPHRSSSPWPQSNIELANQTLAQAQRSLCRGCRQTTSRSSRHRNSVAAANQSNIASLSCLQRCENLARAGDRHCRAIGAAPTSGAK